MDKPYTTTPSITVSNEAGLDGFIRLMEALKPLDLAFTFVLKNGERITGFYAGHGTLEAFEYIWISAFLNSSGFLEDTMKLSLPLDLVSEVEYL